MSRTPSAAAVLALRSALRRIPVPGLKNSRDMKKVRWSDPAPLNEAPPFEVRDPPQDLARHLSCRLDQLKKGKGPFRNLAKDPLRKEIEPLLEAFPWKYAKEILRAAAYCAREPSLYPVMVTCFKCAPDSFILEYFKRILDAHGKPYLVLQVDDKANVKHLAGHDPETRRSLLTVFRGLVDQTEELVGQ